MILLTVFIIFLLKIWLKMANLNTVSMKIYPLWINVQIRNLLF